MAAYCRQLASRGPAPDYTSPHGVALCTCNHQEGGCRQAPGHHEHEEENAAADENAAAEVAAVPCANDLGDVREAFGVVAVPWASVSDEVPKAIVVDAVPVDFPLVLLGSLSTFFPWVTPVL